MKNKTQDNSCSTCQDCSQYLNLQGFDVSKFDYCIALAGNPNTGKSTVFNSLTGLRQHTGNWPGKTVTRAEGGYKYKEKTFKLVDLPGTYSLLSTSTDEEVARDFILFGQPDCTIIVVDATCLERNLNLVLQILEITDRVVVALNLMDEAKRKGMDIDTRSLSKDLGVPVIPTIAKTREGLGQLTKIVEEIVTKKVVNKPYKIKLEISLEKTIDSLTPVLKKTYPKLSNPKWIAMRLLDGDAHIREALTNGQLESLYIGK